MPVISKHAKDLVKFDKLLCKRGGNSSCVFNNIESNVALVLLKTNKWTKNQEKKAGLYETALTQEGEVRACRFVTPLSQDAIEVTQDFKKYKPTITKVMRNELGTGIWAISANFWEVGEDMDV